MSPDEIARLAASAHAHRPDWPTASLRTFIEANYADHAYGDVAVAMAWVCTKTKTATPRLLREGGIWWQAARLDGASAPAREPWNRADFCATTGMPMDRCVRVKQPDDEHVCVSTHERDKRVTIEQADRKAASR